MFCESWARAGSAQSAAAIATGIQFFGDITSQDTPYDGGTWTVDLVSSPPTCQRGEHGSPQCTIEASDADFRGMVDGGMQAAMSLFFSGKLKVSGDPILATKLSKLLQMAG